MNSSESSQSGLSLRLSVIGVPACMINPFVELLCRWSRCSGDEWTVKRCKSLKLTLIQLRSGLLVTAPLARNRNGEISGVVGSLLRWGLKSDKNFVKALNAFMVYTHWLSSKLTKDQKKKFLTAVHAKPIAMSANFTSSFVRTVKSTIPKRIVHEVPKPLMFFRGSSTKRAPTTNGPVSQSEKLLAELMLVNNTATMDHINSLWHRIYSHVFSGIDIRGFCESAHTDEISDGPMLAGEVHFIQEPGYKCRSIASPYRTFQVASLPLQRDLGNLVKGLEWDCTHEQGKATPFIREYLKKRQQVYSVDLSSATDYFPFELQMTVLETVYGKDDSYVRLFRDVSRASWKSELGAISWTKGQPLGFNPSFFLFTLTHGLVLLSLVGGRYNHEFFVLGDDVVILDKDLYVKYLSFLKEAGCPYSADKSLISNELAEFAGKVVTSSNTYPQLKWRKVSDDNFLDLARLIGPRIRLLLSKKQQTVLDTFAHVPDFIHPYGLNWSYPGSNLETMIAKGLNLCFEERVLDSLTGLSASVNSQLYADYGPYTSDLLRYVDKTYLEKEVLTFDEKVKSVFLKVGFARKHYEYFLENLKDVPSVLWEGSKPPELPVAEASPTRMTFLQRMSRFIFQTNRL